uniref:Lipase domain-containing protein n=1 Tax=Graphocephala atropunctata TaxID=36148 RepID=A0A1B6KBN1_9HEMI
MVLSETAFIITFSVLIVHGIIENVTKNDGQNTLETPPTERCYPKLGCFSLEYPWVSRERPFNRLPEGPDEIGTTFYLSTRRYHNSKRRKLTIRPKVILEGSDWQPRRWTVIITHGFRGNAVSSWVRELEATLLEIKDMNVVSCDWTNGSSGWNYVRAAANARVVGAEVARFIRHLLVHKLATSDRIHLIGQSLGAHVLSYISATVKNIARLTALDPAQPGFEGAHPDTRVDASDANFVDVIHTSGDHIIASLGFGLGMVQPVGHVDFYVNGGKKQPQCWVSKRILQQLYAIPEAVIDILGCSHQKAHVYYMEALKSKCSFWGKRSIKSSETCSPSSCQQMGRFTSVFPAHGNFYVKTNIEPPYCVHEPVNDYVMEYHWLGRYKQKYIDSVGGI